MGAVSSVVNAVVDVVEDVGSTLDDIVIQPAVDLVEGSIDLSKNSLETAGKVNESLLKGDFSSADDELRGGINNIDNILSETYMDVRDPLEAAAVIGGNYFLPGSSMITSRLVSDGAQDILNTNGGQTLNFAAGATGGYQGNSANWTGGTPAPTSDVGYTNGADIASDQAVQQATQQAAQDEASRQLTQEQVASSVSQEALKAANATSDPLGALVAEQGWSSVDPSYLKAIGVTEGMTPAITQATNSGYTMKQALDFARAGMLINSITGDPLGLNGDTFGNQGTGNQGTGQTSFNIIPVPEGWKPPESQATSFTPIDLSSIFSNQDMLQGTQWQGLQGNQFQTPLTPTPTFNDIFNSGPVSANMGQPININDIVGAILGQSATSQKPA